MTKKTKTDTVLDKAEVLLRDIEAASRGRRLRNAEKDVKDGMKPKTRGGRLIAAERQVKASKPRDPRLVWRDTV